MALPLLAAAGVEARQLQLQRWRRIIELACLSVLLIGRLAKLGWVLTVILLLFALCGARLSLPRNRSTRIQTIFMAFLLFLLTTVANTSISFLPWTLIWTAIAGLTLFQIFWENKAEREKKSKTYIPLGRVATWTIAAAIISVIIFLILPRPSLGWRPLPFGINGLTGTYTGLTDKLSLDGDGPIMGSGEAVVRILPPPNISESQRRAMGNRMSLLIGIRLEQAQEGRWEVRRQTSNRYDLNIEDQWAEAPDALECYVYPSPIGLIPMPYGRLQVFPPRNIRMHPSSGGSIRWSYPLARPMPFKFRLLAPEAETIPDWQINRRGLRLPDPATIEALNWSLRIAPRGLHPTDLVELLTRELRTYTYTLDNPSGKARDSLGDFLNRTRAGHCEYFAHALASALRHRGMASRVVNGYRLGQWIQEGGYWLVTQNDAHSWVEYVDPETNMWIAVDPTPPLSASFSGRWRIAEKMNRMVDAMRFRWDRYVVRYSDAEQQKGAAWVTEKATKIWNMRPNAGTVYFLLSCIALLYLAFEIWRRRHSLERFFNPTFPPGTILALRPLIKSARLQPLQGETLRAWFVRLGKIRTERKIHLMQLADLIEDRVYGQSDSDIVKPIKEEAREWKSTPVTETQLTPVGRE